MSKIGQEYARRLEQAGADLRKALRDLVDRIDQGLAQGEKIDMEPARKALARVESL